MTVYDVFFIEKRLYIQILLVKKEYIVSLSVAQVTVTVSAFFPTFLRTEAFHGHVQINSTTAI